MSNARNVVKDGTSIRLHPLVLLSTAVAASPATVTVPPAPDPTRPNVLLASTCRLYRQATQSQLLPMQKGLRFLQFLPLQQLRNSTSIRLVPLPVCLLAQTINPLRTTESAPPKAKVLTDQSDTIPQIQLPPPIPTTASHVMRAAQCVRELVLTTAQTASMRAGSWSLMPTAPPSARLVRTPVSASVNSVLTTSVLTATRRCSSIFMTTFANAVVLTDSSARKRPMPMLVPPLAPPRVAPKVMTVHAASSAPSPI